MSNQCFIVQVNKDNVNTLEVFKIETEKKQMLDRVSELVGSPLDARSKKVAGQIMDNDLSVFEVGRGLRSILLQGANYRSAVQVFLGSLGKFVET